MQLRIHGVGNYLHHRECEPPITTPRSVNILILTLYGVSEPTAAGFFSGKFSQRITVLPLESISRILTLVRVSALPQHAPHQTKTVSAPPDILLPW